MANPTTPSLAPDQKFVQARMQQLLSKAHKVDVAYNAIPESHNGKIVSVDIARFLAPEFATWDGRVRHTLSTSRPAGEYAHARILRELARPRDKRVLLVTAGGAGAGKTSALKLGGESSIANASSLVFDNQFRDWNRATLIVDTALRHRWRVRLLFVHRSFEEVVRGVAERSLRTGRWNDLWALPGAHLEARRTFLRLIQEYRGTAGVSMGCLINAKLPEFGAERTILYAAQAQRFLSRAMQTARSRAMIQRGYQSEVRAFFLRGAEYLARVEASQANLQDFLGLLGKDKAV